jgi:hypothetical protein
MITLHRYLKTCNPVNGKYAVMPIGLMDLEGNFVAFKTAKYKLVAILESAYPQFKVYVYRLDGRTVAGVEGLKIIESDDFRREFGYGRKEVSIANLRS